MWIAWKIPWQLSARLASSFVPRCDRQASTFFCADTRFRIEGHPPRLRAFPHLLLHALFAQFPDEWRNRIIGHRWALEAFWDGMSANDKRHATLAAYGVDRVSCRRRCVPLLVHEDGVPCANRKSLDVISWQSILGSGFSTSVKFLITGIFNTLKSKHTMPQVWKVISWCFTVLASGVFRTLTGTEKRGRKVRSIVFMQERNSLGATIS